MKIITPKTQQKPKANVYIDGANMYFAQKKLGWQIDWQKVKSYLELLYNVTEIRYYSGLKDEDESMKKYLHKLKGYGFTVITKPLKKITVQAGERLPKGKQTDSGGNVIFKANFDVEIAFDLARLDSQVTSVILMSGDSDFAYPMIVLKNEGILTQIIASKQSLSWELRKCGARLFLLENIGDAIKNNKKEPDTRSGSVNKLNIANSRRVVKSNRKPRSENRGSLNGYNVSKRPSPVKTVDRESENSSSFSVMLNLFQHLKLISRIIKILKRVQNDSRRSFRIHGNKIAPRKHGGSVNKNNVSQAKNYVETLDKKEPETRLGFMPLARLFLSGVVLFSLLVAVYPTPAFATGMNTKDWPTFGGNPAHNKISPSTSTAPLTVYFRQKANLGPSSFFYTGGGGPAVAFNTIYAIAAPDATFDGGTRLTSLVAFDMNGHQKWKTQMPVSVNFFLPSISVADDGAIYTGYSAGLNAYNSNGTVRFTDACSDFDTTSHYNNVRAVNIAHNGTIFSTRGNSGDIIGCDPFSGLLTIRTTEFAAFGGGGKLAGQPTIDSNDIIYFKNNNGLHATRASDASLVWIAPCNVGFGGGTACNGTYNNHALSLDEKYLAAYGNNQTGIIMFNAKTGAGMWNYIMGCDACGEFTFGMNDRIYVSIDITGKNGSGNGVAGTPIPNNIGANKARICALEVVSGKEIWCKDILGYPQQADMLVDSTNSLFFEMGNDGSGDGSVDRFDKNGQLTWKYMDKVNFTTSSDSPAMSDDGRLFIADRYLEGFRPWTLQASALKKPAGTSTAVYFTVKSSMLKHDLQDGVTADNQVQVRFDGGVTVPLHYLHQDGDDTVWEGIYSIPTGTDLSKVQLKGQIEAIANQTSSNLVTHFASVPGGFNNTGMVQAFDFGTADKISGTAAQTSGGGTMIIVSPAFGQLSHLSPLQPPKLSGITLKTPTTNWQIL